MISDNASTYLSAANEIKRLLDSPEIQTYLTNRRVQWSFIPKRAPWFEGFWERLIGLAKTAIKKVLGRSFVTYDELNTIITEIESTLNDRPLTYVSTDIDDATPLTPSHLLIGRLVTPLPHFVVDDDELSDPTFGNRLDLEKRHAHICKLLEQFWKRWTSEYLTSLRERHNNTVGATDNTIKVGDVVLMHSDIARRVNWRLATVQRLNVGNDGLARSAELKTTSGFTNRPITKLYPLEACGNNAPTLSIEKSLAVKSVLPGINETVTRCPPRTAATIARLRIQDMNDM
ncbi:uncharacterized protein LOC102803486 [Saccoglossus kowalevskii]|uniref:Uncharacterized protein LOC102803486 n=1 Tax=Saccoglossus kowalevskii TaxID=10224 RepID=A0ABM0M3F0_SACKO|nr:PREDICTED: uncharacterized protein LOC102803486 [Saccoglossus kowalevskii]